MSMNKLTAFTIAAQYTAAIAAQNEERMQVLRAGSYKLDAVYLDAYGVAPLAEPEGKGTYRSLFSAFPDGDLAVTRTIAGAEVVVQEWTFSGTHTRRTERGPFAVTCTSSRPAERCACGASPSMTSSVD